MATAEARVPRGPALSSSDADLERAAEVRSEDIALALAWLRLYAPELARMVEAVSWEQEDAALALMAGLVAGGNRYLFLARRGLYYDVRQQKPIDPVRVRQLLDRALDRAGRDARLQTMGLRLGRVDLPGWELAIRGQTKSAHIAATMTGLGGERRTHLAALARMQETVTEQFAYLSRFAQQIESGEQPLDGRALQRTEAYVQTARAAHMEARNEVAASVGFDQLRNIRYPGDSCAGCLKMEELGWVQLADPRWVPIGERDCLWNCRCSVRYRNSSTGETDGELGLGFFST